MRNNVSSARWLRLAAVLALCLMSTGLSYGQTFTTLYDFYPYPNGAEPSGPIQGSDGNFYGTTDWGGPSNYGTVYRVTPKGVQSVLHAFAGPDGANPIGSLVQGSDGNFYGVTTYGGPSFGSGYLGLGYGEVFRITPTGVMSTLCSFSSPDALDSPLPTGSLVLASDGNFYGTTQFGGANENGTVFRVTPDGVLTTLYSFDFVFATHTFPSPLIQGSDGNLYGITGGAVASNLGTVFKVSLDGALTTLYAFSGPDGALPISLVQGTNGDFYGITGGGGTSFGTGGPGEAGVGTVFTITTDGALTTLYAFGGPDGSLPIDLVLGVDGSFYGTTMQGGPDVSSSSPGYGTLFKITPGGALTTLYNFSSTDAGQPHGGLIQGNDGNFYGTTSTGGSNTELSSTWGRYPSGPDNGADYTGYGAYIHGGALFKFMPGGVITPLYNFNGFDSCNPDGGLVLGPDGSYYGNSATGSSLGGTVFRTTPTGATTVLHSFSGPVDGFEPAGRLLAGSDGNFYGVTTDGGDQSFYGVASDGGDPDSQYYPGTVFRITSSGVFTTLYSFSGPDGLLTYSGVNTAGVGGVILDAPSLIEGSDGNFYGTTPSGGATYVDGSPSGFGTVFRITANGVLTTLYSFSGADGEFPAGGVVEGAEGNFYGTTSGDIFSNYGAVYRITPAGELTTLYSFSGTDGEWPVGRLVRASDGNLYGTTSLGGADYSHKGGEGTVFKITTDGVLTTLYSFSGPDGAYPISDLIQASDGNFYGTTSEGGPSWQGGGNLAYGFGTVFRITPSGILTTLYSFGNSGEYYEAGDPAGLFQGSDGRLYGTATYGGLHESGTVFALDVGLRVTPPNAPTDLTATAGNAQVKLSWNASVDATSYTVYRGTVSQSEGATPVETDTTDLTFVDTDLINGTKYFYIVVATDKFGPSLWSNEVTATPGPAVTRVLWSNANGAASIWNYSPSSGAFSQNGYGPYSGWKAIGIADAPDGLTRVLWFNRTTYVMSLWSVNSVTGAYTQHSFGPYPGWTPTAVSVGADDTTHLLWTSVRGVASIWNVDADTGSFTNQSYGPYTGWTPSLMADGPDNDTRLTWNNTSGAASVWSVDNATGTFTQDTYGPYTWWTPTAVSVNAANITHLLWTYQLGAASLWNLDTATGAFTQNSFGPYSGWTATAIADGPDGNTQVLWDNASGAASIWDLDNVTGAYTQHSFGPFSGWTATAVSGFPEGL